MHMQGVDPHRLAAVQLKREREVRLVTCPGYSTELGSLRYFLSGKVVQVSAALLLCDRFLTSRGHLMFAICVKRSCRDILTRSVWCSLCVENWSICWIQLHVLMSASYSPVLFSTINYLSFRKNWESAAILCSFLFFSSFLLLQGCSWALPAIYTVRRFRKKMRTTLGPIW